MIYYNIPEIRKYIKVKEPEDFRKFREMLATEMHGREERLLRGPMWSGCQTEDIGKPDKVNLHSLDST